MISFEFVQYCFYRFFSLKLICLRYISWLRPWLGYLQSAHFFYKLINTDHSANCMGQIQDGCVCVNDIARTHLLQATDDGSFHGQSAAEKRRRRRRCGDDGLSHKRRVRTTDVCRRRRHRRHRRRHLVYPPPPFVRVKIRYTRPDAFSESSCII